MQVSKARKGYKLVDTGFGKFEEIPEEWEFKKLENISEIVGGGTPDSNNKEFWNGSVLWAVPTDITQLSSKFIENTERKISQKGLEKSSAKLLPVGTILITSRATIGECAIAKKPISTNQGFQNLICNENNFNQFWYYAIQFHKNKLLKLCNATTFLEISKNNMKKILIESPTRKTEQQKISSIISNIDNTLEKTNQLIKKTELLKKGLMQELFTKGIGHTKFKSTLNGKIPEEWKEFKIKDIIFDLVGGTPLKPIDFSVKGFAVLHKGDIKPNNILEIGKTNPFCTKEFAELYKSHIIDDSYVVVTLRDLVPSGPAIGLMAHSNTKYLLAQGAYGFHVLNNKVDSKFLVHLSNSTQYRKYIKKMSVGSTQIHVRTPVFLNMIFYIPSLKEQKQIADILNNFDSQIIKEKLNKSNLELLKKGLMQKLLTGQIRVTV